MPTSEVLTTVSETVNGVPRLNGPPEFDTVCSTRSGNATVMAPADARQLLVSSLSATSLVSSAHADRKYVPGGVADGIVTVTVRVDVAPAASVGTDRVPVSSLSSRALLGVGGEIIVAGGGARRHGALIAHRVGDGEARTRSGRRRRVRHDSLHEVGTPDDDSCRGREAIVQLAGLDDDLEVVGTGEQIVGARRRGERDGTVVVPADCAPAARVATVRLPVSSVSPASFAASSDR